MSNTDKLREFADRWGLHYNEEGGKLDDERKECLSDLTALISEGYVDKDIHDRLIERADELTTELEELKLKYDDLLQQRNELKEKLSEAIATIKAIKAVNDAAIK